MYIVHSSLFWFFAYYYIEKKEKSDCYAYAHAQKFLYALIILVITDIS